MYLPKKLSVLCKKVVVITYFLPIQLFDISLFRSDFYACCCYYHTVIHSFVTTFGTGSSNV